MRVGSETCIQGRAALTRLKGSPQGKWRVIDEEPLCPLPLSLFQSNVSHILICVYLQSVICGIYLVVNSHPLTGCLSSELLFLG